MTVDEFEFYNKEFKRFSKNKKFDVTDINNQISNLIDLNVLKRRLKLKLK